MLRVVRKARGVVTDRRARGLGLPGREQRLGARALDQRIVGELAERLVEYLDHARVVGLRRVVAGEREIGARRGRALDQLAQRAPRFLGVVCRPVQRREDRKQLRRCAGSRSSADSSSCVTSSRRPARIITCASACQPMGSSGFWATSARRPPIAASGLPLSASARGERDLERAQGVGLVGGGQRHPRLVDRAARLVETALLQQGADPHQSGLDAVGVELLGQRERRHGAFEVASWSSACERSTSASACFSESSRSGQARRARPRRRRPAGRPARARSAAGRARAIPAPPPRAPRPPEAPRRLGRGAARARADPRRSRLAARAGPRERRVRRRGRRARAPRARRRAPAPRAPPAKDTRGARHSRAGLSRSGDGASARSIPRRRPFAAMPRLQHAAASSRSERAGSKATTNRPPDQSVHWFQFFIRGSENFPWDLPVSVGEISGPTAGAVRIPREGEIHVEVCLEAARSVDRRGCCGISCVLTGTRGAGQCHVQHELCVLQRLLPAQRFWREPG